MKKLNYSHYLLLVVFSFFVMLFFTKCSPLFLFNDWVDANAYMTMGKGMVHGLIPFKDLFEQKGPLLYLIHAIAYLIRPGTFYGVYIFESIGIFCSLLFMYKIAKYYVTGWKALWISMLFPVLLLFQPFFKLGDSAEEFAVPFVMGLIYLIFKISNDSRTDFRWQYYIQGISLACVFWMKYTLIGAWIGFFLAISGLHIWKKQFKLLGTIIIFSVGGFLTVTIPWLIYFGANHALKELFEVYFVFNMSSYPAAGSFFIKAFNAVLIFFTSFSSHLLLYCILFVGMVLVMFKNEIIRDIESKILLLSSFIFTGFTAFFGGKTYVYYYQILYPFTCVGFLMLMVMLVRKKKNIRQFRINIMITGLVAAGSLMTALFFNQTVKESRFNTEHPTIQISDRNKETKDRKPAQYVFAAIMNKKENPTMLNYGSIDMGFYTIADILPINRYFEVPNIRYKDYPEIVDEQNQIVKEKKVDFVILKGKLGEDIEKFAKKELLENYKVTATHNQRVEKKDMTYWLLEKK